LQEFLFNHFISFEVKYRLFLSGFHLGFLCLFRKIQLALPAVQVCFACGLLCLCWLFAVALWSVRSIFVCGLLWRWLWLLWTLADKSYRPVQLTSGLNSVRS